MTNGDGTPDRKRGVLSMESPITIGFAIVMLGGIYWNIDRMERLQQKIDDGYVSSPVFAAEMRALRAEMSGRFSTLEAKIDILSNALEQQRAR